ncbi:hypothetical protein Pyn_25184 [Prunus yedoensis var. nudiflora]|uniref:Uncharacterized protein n=1 Tax=Prunus yedoensis var. nudiflora TaxID=2094558 RepID=A0A314XNA8_PRUYE|nr:hypothetical protein Pyn_25184 [Prunus yedoensis var. nudiflora]
MAIEDHMKRRYYTWCYNLHQKFLAYGSEEGALEHQPQTVGEDDRNYLVQLWQKDEWKDEMKKLKNLPQTDEESVKLMSDDEIYDSVLSNVVGPPRSGYICGLGVGPKPKTFDAGQYSHATVEEA